MYIISLLEMGRYSQGENSTYNLHLLDQGPLVAGHIQHNRVIRKVRKTQH